MGFKCNVCGCEREPSGFTTLYCPGCTSGYQRKDGELVLTDRVEPKPDPTTIDQMMDAQRESVLPRDMIGPKVAEGGFQLPAWVFKNAVESFGKFHAARPEERVHGERMINEYVAECVKAYHCKVDTTTALRAKAAQMIQGYNTTPSNSIRGRWFARRILDVLLPDAERKLHDRRESFIESVAHRVCKELTGEHSQPRMESKMSANVMTLSIELPDGMDGHEAHTRIERAIFDDVSPLRTVLQGMITQSEYFQSQAQLDLSIEKKDIFDCPEGENFMPAGSRVEVRVYNERS